MNLHLITGYRTEHREGKPTVLYCGADGNEAARALREADPEFLRLEKASVPDSFKIPRSITPRAVAVEAAAGAGAEPEVELAAAIPPVEDEGEIQLVNPEESESKSE